MEENKNFIGDEALEAISAGDIFQFIDQQIKKIQTNPEEFSSESLAADFKKWSDEYTDQFLGGLKNSYSNA